ncbi:MAG: hypothetical protein H0T73_05390 [Ardenticatenales bacterium]|nr:hypothetical protein [Ardenticatenales bacterium]
MAPTSDTTVPAHTAEQEMLEADLALDIAMAQFMGWTKPSDPDALADTGEVWYWVRRGQFVIRGTPFSLDHLPNFRGRWDHGWEAWSPSSQDAPALELLRELPKRGWVATMRQDDSDLFCIEIRARGQQAILGLGYGALPRAICMAIQGLPDG